MDIQNIDSLILLKNNTPVDDFCGLSPTDMNHLLYDTFGDKSPVRINDDCDPGVCDSIPFFRLTEVLLGIVRREGSIKLTGTGALPLKLVRELYEHRIILDEMIEKKVSKLHRQEECMPIHMVRMIAQGTGLVKVAHGEMSLTKKGSGPRVAMLRALLECYTIKFDWGYNDGYTTEPVGQLGWAFTLYMLHTYGSIERPIEFYGAKYLQAFPSFVERVHVHTSDTPQKYLIRCYTLRTFERFLEWFGFVHTKDGQTAPTLTMEKVFRFE